MRPSAVLLLASVSAALPVIALVASCSSGSSPSGSSTPDASAEGAASEAGADAGGGDDAGGGAGSCAHGLRLDPGFGQSGVVVFAPSFQGRAPNLAVLADGSVLVLRRGSAQKVSASGSIDPSFAAPWLAGPDGGLFDFTLAGQSDGKILVGYAAASSAYGATTAGVARLLASGALDTSFGQGGTTAIPAVTTPDGGAVSMATTAVVPGASGDGYAVGLAGEHEVFVAHVSPTGALDTAYGGGSGTLLIPSPLYPRPLGAVLRPDGKLAVGLFQTDTLSGAPSVAFAQVLALLPSGLPDPGFGGDAGVASSDIESFGSMAGLPGGDVLLGGELRIVKVLASGALDPAFGNDNGLLFTDSVDAGFGYTAGTLGIAAAGDGTFTVTGSASASTAGGATAMVARFDDEGRPCGPATAFAAPGTSGGWYVASAPGGAVYVSGYTIVDGGAAQPWVARLAP